MPRSTDFVLRFRDRFVVRIEAPDEPGRLLGSGVLVAPRVVATCWHVVEGLGRRRARVVLGERFAKGKVLIWPDDERRRELDQDVAVVVIDVRLVDDDSLHPPLLVGMTADVLRRMQAAAGAGVAELMSCGHQHSGPQLTPAIIDSGTIGPHGLVTWLRFPQSHRSGESGGPVWLVPTASQEPTMAWRPGLLVALLTGGARHEDSGGPPHSFGIPSDMLRDLCNALTGSGGTSKKSRRAIEKVRFLGADDALGWLPMPADLEGGAAASETVAPASSPVDELLQELARVLWDPQKAKLLAAMAGVSRLDIPAFTTSRSFWTLVVDLAVDGSLPGGVAALARAALELYPANPVFKRHAS